MHRTITSSPKNTSTISEAHASTIRKKATKTEKRSMNGLLRPHLDCEESDNTPTIGWTINPDSGGAIHTRDVWLFAKPNFRRWGSKSAEIPLGGISVEQLVEHEERCSGKRGE